MADQTDFHVGKRLRRRRRLLGLTQQQLAEKVGVRFQQIQKYESGNNRLNASRLYDLSRALEVNVQFFFDGLAPSDVTELPANDMDCVADDVFSQRETMDLLRAYYRLDAIPRKRLLELAKAFEQSDNVGGVA